MSEAQFIPLSEFPQYTPGEMKARANAFYEEMKKRRTVRQFSDRPVPVEIVAACLRAAGSAPSGANMQPWHFVAVSDAGLKRSIRQAAEAEEHEFYTRRASPEWLEALEPLGTNENKPFLEVAPYLIAIFVQRYGLLPDGRQVKHYYAQESVGIATGILITALHHCGLATLTHTPSPMDFLNQILRRPENERPFLLLVTGYPAAEAHVPLISKKPLSEIATFL